MIWACKNLINYRIDIPPLPSLSSAMTSDAPMSGTSLTSLKKSDILCLYALLPEHINKKKLMSYRNDELITCKK
jgi:hypothetical protein